MLLTVLHVNFTLNIIVGYKKNKALQESRTGTHSAFYQQTSLMPIINPMSLLLVAAIRELPEDFKKNLRAA